MSVKTMKNLRNKIDVRNGHQNQAICPTKYLTIIQLQYLKNKFTEMLDKPECFRIYILELSKVLMHEFHYNYIKNKYGQKSRLLFRGTDSSVYKIKTVYEDFSSNKEIFNYTNYSTKSKYYIDLKK